MYSLKRNKGSMTVEASLIFPVIFLAIIALIYITVFLYEQAYVKSIADRAAERGAAIWKNPKSDMYIGLVKLNDFKENDPYWRIADTNKATKEAKIESYIETSLKKYSIFLMRDKDGNMDKNQVTVDAQVRNYVVYKKLTVNVKKKFKLPIGNALSAFGLDNIVEISAKSEALINEPAEFIRSTDFAMDVGKRIDDATGNRMEKVKDKLGGFLNGIGSKVDSFLK